MLVIPRQSLRARVAARLRRWSDLLWRHTNGDRNLVSGVEARRMVRHEDR